MVTGFFMPLTETYSTQDFLNYLTFQKRYSKHTVISYQNDLKGFFDFIFLHYQSIALKEISAPMVRSWLASLKENKAASKTINRKISSLKSFFKYQLKMKNIAVSPMATTSSLKVSRRLPSFIEQKDINTLLTDTDFGSSWEGKLNYLILELLYQTGIRLNELIHLQEGHIDKQTNTIKVLGKGNKERIIPVNNQLLQLIDKYISEKRIQFPESSNIYLLVSKKGKILYPKYVYNMVKLNLGRVSTNERKSPHVLRHSFATHLTNNGAQINAIKDLLGHSSLAATQIYTHNSIEKLKEVHKLAHPKS
ncbi:MAG: tyrosine-type recombinase/integrase [Bacteroidota bacterium]|nr:tyrosine-type recombinase/integrase [Bacteroidota bacterium]